MKLKLVPIFLMMLIAGCGKEEKAIIRPVMTETVKEISESLSYEYPGIVSSGRESILAFKVAGPIDKLNVEVGTFVKAGEIIAEMDKRDYNIKLKAYENKVYAAKSGYEAAKAISQNAKKQFQRVEKLYREKAIPKKTYDEALAGKESAVAGELAKFALYEEALQGLENCKNQLEDTNLKAPYDGYIHKKFSDAGTVVGAGYPVVSISSIGDNKITIGVSEKDLSKISIGLKAEFLYKGNIYPIEISDIGKVKGTGNLTYPVTFKFLQENNISIDSEGIVRLGFKNSLEDGVLISAESVFERDGIAKVWIYENESVVEKNINLIKPYSDGKILVTGLEDGQKIVSKGVHELSNGQKVKVLEPFSDTNIGEVL